VAAAVAETKGIIVTTLKKPRISPDSIVVAANEQVSSDVRGRAVILGIKSGKYYSLSDVGARIWELLQQPRSVREIGDTIQAEYDVETERCDADVLNLLESLVSEELVEIRAA
jgi:hypothetical protein